jgi:hypothetical protein
MSTSTTSSLSDYLAQLGVDVNNMQEFLNKLSQVLSTKSDTVTVTQTLQDGTTKDFLIPSFGYLSNKVTNLEQTFGNLLEGNSNQIGIKDPNGNVRTFELKDIANVVSNLDTVNTKSVDVPDSFNYKTNWFFESFLNPLLYINIDTSSISTDSDINMFEAKRIIVTSSVATDKDYFDSNYKGKNNLSYTEVIKDLNARGIQYFEDSSDLFLPPAKNTARGSFDILNILEDTQSEVIGGQTLTIVVRKYKLSTIRYSEVTATTTVDKTLQVGDHLMSQTGSEYLIKSVDSNQRTVILELIFGQDGLAQGAKQLIIKPNLQRDTLVQLNLGYNERNLIFLRPISERLAITTDQYSQGFGIFTNELKITMNNGSQMTLEDFYQSFVSDFGLLFLNYAKEKKLPSSLGEIPNTVTLSPANFKVIQVDQHIQDADNTLAIKQKISAKEQASSQIREIDKQIFETRANLNTNSSLNESQRLKLQKDLQSQADSRATLSKTQQSLISDITSSIKSTPSFVTSPVYKVRGFWPIPDPVLSSHGLQNTAQFKIAYRTLSKTGNAKSPDQIEFTDNKGNKIAGAFSPWTEILSKPRRKTYNTLTGFYEWADESVSDPEEVNSNQLEVPIKKGEVIEIKIKSLSEAGWPDSPIESEWSSSILIDFPKEIETAEDATIVSQQAFAEETRLSFQDELNAKGLDIHLSTAFTTRDKYYAHKTEDIASGFFATDGSIVDLYTKIKSLSDTLSSVQTSISTGRGSIGVSIIDQLGNQRALTNGQSIDLFAGYYKDLVKDSSGTTVVYNYGKIITIQYLIQIQNSSQTPLQLMAALNGGVSEAATTSDPIAYPTVGYHTTLRYDLPPISMNNAVTAEIGAISQKDGYQSAQVKSQFVHSRFKDVKVSANLFAGDGLTAGSIYSLAAGSTSGTYGYGGLSVGSPATKIPYAYGHYLPYDPTLSSLTIQINGTTYTTVSNANVWNGTMSGTSGVGGGRLSEFCMHKDHPEITVAWAPTFFKPGYGSSDTNQKYLPFSQAIHSEIGEIDAANAFGAKFYQQAEYSLPNTVIIPTASASMIEDQYPIKSGFVPNDEYLVGRYTCGAYLTLSPTSHETISVDGLSPAGSYKNLEYGADNAIKIPLTFQFRAADKLGYVGGWRADTPDGLKNIKYTKKLGIDIYTKDSVFSFDVKVSGQFQKETAVVTPITAVTASAATA